MDDTRKKNAMDSATYLYWKGQIETAEKNRKTFVDKGDKILKQYRDDNRLNEAESKYNILYSNTETLLPVCYSEKPIPDMRARNPKYVPSRKAAEMIEKTVSYYLNNNEADFDDLANLAVLDFLLPGLGVMRPKYKPTIEDKDEEIGIEDITEDDADSVKEGDDGKIYRTSQEITNECLEFEYVFWKNYLEPDYTNRKDLPWMAFKDHLTQSQAETQFGAKIANQLTYSEIKDKDSKTLDDMKDEAGQEKKAKIYEIWDKGFKQQIFFAENRNNQVLEINDDPLGMENFWPIPTPLYSMMTGGSSLPVPFFHMYQDQAIELNDINQRISAMVANMRRVGVYDAAFPELKNLSNMSDNQLYPVKNWDDLVGKGGLIGVMQTEDISSYAEALEVLREARQSILEDIYQIMGLSDIRRGQTDPRETLGAQKLKGRYGTIRISPYQRKVSRFMRDLIRVAGEIIINQFQPETIAAICNMPVKTTMDPQNPKKVLEVGVEDLLNDLRSKSPSDVLIDIETDVSILDQEDTDVEDITQIMSAMTEFSQSAPAMAQVLGIDATSDLLLSIVQKLKLGRDIQQSIQDNVDKVKKAAENPQPQQPTPEQLDYNKKMAELAFSTHELQVNSKIKMADLGIKQQANILKAKELDQGHLIENHHVDLKAIDGFINMHNAVNQPKEKKH